MLVTTRLQLIGTRAAPSLEQMVQPRGWPVGVGFDLWFSRSQLATTQGAPPSRRAANGPECTQSQRCESKSAQDGVYHPAAR